MNIDTVIFDLDGTLLDTLDDLYESVNVALLKSGFPKRSKGEIRRFLGNGIRRLIEQSVPGYAGPGETDIVFEDFKSYYMEHCEDRTKIFDGMAETLNYLKENHVNMAIVSNKADEAVQELALKYFKGVISVAVGEREGVKRKPEPDSVYEVIRKLDVRKDTVIYVGDSEVDRETAANAGVPCVLVSWGFREEEFLRTLNPEYLIHHPREIIEILK